MTGARMGDQPVAAPRAPLVRRQGDEAGGQGAAAHRGLDAGGEIRLARAVVEQNDLGGDRLAGEEADQRAGVVALERDEDGAARGGARPGGVVEQGLAHAALARTVRRAARPRLRSPPASRAKATAPKTAAPRPALANSSSQPPKAGT